MITDGIEVFLKHVGSGRRFDEYLYQEPRTGKELTFVEASDEARFSVNVRVLQGFDFRGADSLQVRLCLDDHDEPDEILCRKPREISGTGKVFTFPKYVAKVRDSWMVGDLAFGKIELDEKEDGEITVRNEDLGTIRVHITRGHDESYLLLPERAERVAARNPVMDQVGRVVSQDSTITHLVKVVNTTTISAPRPPVRFRPLVNKFGDTFRFEYSYRGSAMLAQFGLASEQRTSSSPARQPSTAHARHEEEAGDSDEYEREDSPVKRARSRTVAKTLPDPLAADLQHDSVATPTRRSSSTLEPPMTPALGIEEYFDDIAAADNLQRQRTVTPTRPPSSPFQTPPTPLLGLEDDFNDIADAAGLERQRVITSPAYEQGLYGPIRRSGRKKNNDDPNYIESPDSRGIDGDSMYSEYRAESVDEEVERELEKQFEDNVEDEDYDLGDKAKANNRAPKAKVGGASRGSKEKASGANRERKEKGVTASALERRASKLRRKTGRPINFFESQSRPTLQVPRSAPPATATDVTQRASALSNAGNPFSSMQLTSSVNARSAQRTASAISNTGNASSSVPSTYSSNARVAQRASANSNAASLLSSVPSTSTSTSNARVAQRASAISNTDNAFPSLPSRSLSAARPVSTLPARPRVDPRGSAFGFFGGFAQRHTPAFYAPDPSTRPSPLLRAQQQRQAESQQQRQAEFQQQSEQRRQKQRQQRVRGGAGGNGADGTDGDGRGRGVGAGQPGGASGGAEM